MVDVITSNVSTLTVIGVVAAVVTTDVLCCVCCVTSSPLMFRPDSKHALPGSPSDRSRSVVTGLKILSSTKLRTKTVQKVAFFAGWYEIFAGWYEIFLQAGTNPRGQTRQ